MQYLLASGLFLSFYFLLGIAFTLWISPRFLRPHAWALAPWVGYCWVAVVGWYGYRLELPGTRSYVGWFLVPPALAGIAWWVTARVRKQPRTFVLSEVAAPLVAGILIFVAVSLPFLAPAEGLTVYSLVNADAADTDSLAAFLAGFSRSDGQGFLGQHSHYLRWLADTFVFGGPMSIAMAAAVIPFETWQLQHVSIHAFFVFGALLLYLLARDLLRFTRAGALAVMALYGLSPVMYFTMYQTYQAQTIAMGLALAVALVLLRSWESASTWKDWLGAAVLLALFDWGISLTYPHMLTLAYLPVLAGCIALAWFQRRWKRLFTCLALVATGLAGMLTLYPPRGPGLVRMLVARGSEAAGWFMPWLSPEALVGLTLKVTDLTPNPGWVRLALSLAVLAMVAWGWLRTAREDRGSLVLAVALCGTVIVGYAVLCFTGRVDQGWGGYKSYKLVSFFLPFLLLAACLLFRKVELRPRRRSDVVVLACLALLLAGNLFSDSSMVRRMRRSHRVVTTDMVGLGRLAGDARVGSVNILGNDWWDILWEARFLMTKTLHFETSTYSGRPASRLDGEWDLVRRTPETEPLFAAGGGPRPDLIRVSSSYLLRRHTTQEQAALR